MTGKVVQAPATEPLHELNVTAENGKIVAGPAA
jgi:Rieske Fe-S protein